MLQDGEPSYGSNTNIPYVQVGGEHFKEKMIWSQQQQNCHSSYINQQIIKLVQEPPHAKSHHFQAFVRPLHVEIHRKTAPLSQEKLHFLSFVNPRNFSPLNYCQIGLNLFCVDLVGGNFCLNKWYLMITSSTRREAISPGSSSPSLSLLHVNTLLCKYSANFSPAQTTFTRR